jgi:hypothetical protein
MKIFVIAHGVELDRVVWTWSTFVPVGKRKELSVNHRSHTQNDTLANWCTPGRSNLPARGEARQNWRGRRRPGASPVQDRAEHRDRARGARPDRAPSSRRPDWTARQRPGPEGARGLPKAAPIRQRSGERARAVATESLADR